MPRIKTTPGAQPPKAPKEDSRLVYRDEKRFRMPVALIIIVIWALMVAVVMNIRTLVKTGDNTPVSESNETQPAR